MPPLLSLRDTMEMVLTFKHMDLNCHLEFLNMGLYHYYRWAIDTREDSYILVSENYGG